MDRRACRGLTSHTAIVDRYFGTDAQDFGVGWHSISTCCQCLTKSCWRIAARRKSCKTKKVSW